MDILCRIRGRSHANIVAERRFDDDGVSKVLYR